MSDAPISIANASHYAWGGTNRDVCDGWHLVRTDELSVIEESMPPGASEIRHHHVRSRQFFYVLSGRLTMELDTGPVILDAGKGIEVAPGQIHKATNISDALVQFLVISQPSSQADRIDDVSS